MKPSKDHPPAGHSPTGLTKRGCIKATVKGRPEEQQPRWLPHSACLSLPNISNFLCALILMNQFNSLEIYGLSVVSWYCSHLMTVFLKASDTGLNSRATHGHAGTVCHKLESFLRHVPNLKAGGGTEQIQGHGENLICTLSSIADGKPTGHYVCLSTGFNLFSMREARVHEEVG